MSRLLPKRLRSINKVDALLVVAVLTVIAGIAWSVTADEDGTATTEQTATVSRGEVTASVTASGNLESASTVNLSFDGSGGTVERIYVKVGDRVEKGDALAAVDQTSARQSLATARASLSSAEAQRSTTTQGQTPQERQRDSRSVSVAKESVRAAEVALRAARDSYELDQRIHNGNVSAAEQQVTAAQQQLSDAQAAHAASPTDATQQAVDSAQTALSGAQSTLRNARTTRSTVFLQDKQNVDSRASSLSAARASLSSTRANVAVNAQPARAGAVEAADSQVELAAVGVAQAQDTLEKTVLRAPVAGTVASINGAVGQPSSAGSTGGSTTGSTDTSTSTTSTSGFVTLTDDEALQVVASVAEADINDVKTGQPATVELSASGITLDGVVSGIDTVQTVTNNVVEYGVTIRINGDTQGARLGQSSEITITTGTKTDVLRAPSSALTTVAGQTTATVKTPSGATQVVAVQVGLEGDAQTEIVSGLSDGDILVLAQQASAPGGFSFPGGGPPGGLGGLGGP